MRLATRRQRLLVSIVVAAMAVALLVIFGRGDQSHRSKVATVAPTASTIAPSTSTTTSAPPGIVPVSTDVTTSSTRPADDVSRAEANLTTSTTMPPPVAVLSAEPLLYQDDSGVHAINPDGSADTLLFTEPDFASDFRWSPDHTRIASSTRRGVVVQDADGTDAHVVVERGGGGGLAWSPDGTELAYVCPTNQFSAICIIGVDGGQATVLTPPDDPLSDEPDWSPDGTRLVYRRQHADYTQSVTIIDLATDTLTDIVTTSGSPDTVEYVIDPRWSPTRPLIAYAHKPPNDVRYDVWVVGTDGTDAHKIVDEPKGNTPRWSPDGTRIAFQADVPFNDYNDPRYDALIYLVAIDGTNGSSVPLPKKNNAAFDDW